MNKLKIKTGDTVKVMSGKDKGKTGKVLRVIPADRKLVVENINIHTKFQKSKQSGQPGTRVSAPGPMAISKVMVVDSNSGNPSRISYKMMDNGKKQRIGKDSGKAM